MSLKYVLTEKCIPDARLVRLISRVVLSSPLVEEIPRLSTSGKL
ncbi:MAG: hypothetical protein OP8BY_1353 [Candidatus Saccharicenans subterraneus]|uniref:Uncharacterized protein n=1 Tax=Candidatus Saccharicenans subterraneus TaxID=2508984 RepID=A0A3E2BPQ1_9BACT|nr:MAG: hypothetical protein OP8BY_1353 [Candidatus Saccharicenans subterraneum]